MQVDLNDKEEQGFFQVINFQELEYYTIELDKEGLEMGGDGPK